MQSLAYSGQLLRIIQVIWCCYAVTILFWKVSVQLLGVLGSH